MPVQTYDRQRDEKARPHSHSGALWRKVQVLGELFVCCLHRQQLDSRFQRTSRLLKGGVRVRRESQKWFSHAHRIVLVFINPYCTSLQHLKQTSAGSRYLQSKSTLVCCVIAGIRHLSKQLTATLLIMQVEICTVSTAECVRLQVDQRWGSKWMRRARLQFDFHRSCWAKDGVM